MSLKSSPFNPIYNTNPTTNNLQVELVNNSLYDNSTSTINSIASNTNSTILLTANSNRNNAIIINDSMSNLYLLLNDSDASPSNYSILLAGKSSPTQIPSSIVFSGRDYTGQITGVWDSADGFARVTEVIGLVTDININQPTISNNVTAPTSFTVKTVCFTTPLVEKAFNMFNVKKLILSSKTDNSFRISTQNGDTINTQNYETILGNEKYIQEDINFTDTLYISVENVPTIKNILVNIYQNQLFVGGIDDFHEVVVGQAILCDPTIPINTYVIAKSADDQIINMGDENGNPVYVTGNGEFTVGFAGAVTTISKWI